MPKQIKHTASNKHMTLDELGAFVADALRSGASGSESVSAQITMGGKLKNVATEVVAAAAADFQK
ncbi:hypothetical protein ACIRVF_08235 [Kitasatospora sp. NPDC101157]|uniref:hypothetical protein n=1 Tax=Kitasatospora sp. NPDC101157 TaxID=3364098 RepID=UPI00380C1143